MSLAPSPVKASGATDYLDSLGVTHVAEDSDDDDDKDDEETSLYVSPESTKAKSSKAPGLSAAKNVRIDNMSRLAGSMAEVLKGDNTNKAIRMLQNSEVDERMDYFDKLKRDSSIVSIKGNWLQWQSSKGVIFYTSGGSNAQFEKPSAFEEQDEEGVVLSTTPTTVGTQEEYVAALGGGGRAVNKSSKPASLRELMRSSKNSAHASLQSAKSQVEVPSLDLSAKHPAVLSDQQTQQKPRFPTRMEPSKAAAKPPIGTVPAHIIKKSTERLDGILSPLSGRSESGWSLEPGNDDDFYDPMRIGDTYIDGIASIKEV